MEAENRTVHLYNLQQSRKEQAKNWPKGKCWMFIENIEKCIKIVHLCWRFALSCCSDSASYTVNGILLVSLCACLRETNELPAWLSFLQFSGLWAQICHFIPTMPGTEFKPAWFQMKARGQSWLFPLAVLQTLIPQQISGCTHSILSQNKYN